MRPASDRTDSQPAPSEPRLEDLLAAAADGDEDAWREVLARYSARVFALAKSRCRSVDVAEEITQSVFVTVATKLSRGGYAERGRFESWLFRVAMNRIRDEMRRSRRRGSDAADTLGEAAARAPEAELPASLRTLREAIRRLPEPDREVVELRHHGGMSFRQMADLLEEPVGTLLARHHRALRKLKELMAAIEAEHGTLR